MSSLQVTVKALHQKTECQLQSKFLSSSPSLRRDF